MAKPTTTQRGYGWRHQKLRERVKLKVLAGQAICWRCTTPIKPWEPWDLGHDDVRRDIYRGPEHRDCNRGKRANRTPNRPAPALAFFETRVDSQ